MQEENRRVNCGEIEEEKKKVEPRHHRLSSNNVESGYQKIIQGRSQVCYSQRANDKVSISHDV